VISRDAVGVECLEPVEEPVDDAFDGGPGQVGPVVERAQTGERARGIGAVGRALAVEVRKQGQPARPRRRAKGQLVEPVVVGPQQGRDREEHLGCVQGADEGEEPTGRIGEPGDRARRPPTR
jgi:hypothetical protein